MRQTDKTGKIKAVIKLSLLILIVAGGSLVLYVNYGPELFSADSVYRLEEYIRAHRSHALSIIVIAQIIQVIICFLPGQPIQFAASYFFGIPAGFLLSIAGAVMGTAVSFFLAKVLGRDFLYVVFSKDKIDEYHRRLNSGKGLMIVLLLYLVPGLPKDLVSYAAGISEMKFAPFLIVSSIARSPGMIGSLLFGYFVSIRNYTAVAVLAVLTVVFIIILLTQRKRILSILDRLEAADARRKEGKIGKETEN